ncbi:hypothetical protein JYT61_00130, partial [bacterium AH-315-E10]|nr:hypothetical protein [bacterium AH-315-E10]
MISINDIEAFVNDGSAILDNLLPMSLIESASQGMDIFYANHPTKSNGIIEYPEDDGLIDLFQHENLERAAQDILGSDSVEMISAAYLYT